jgi:hypothetical protein
MSLAFVWGTSVVGFVRGNAERPGHVEGTPGHGEYCSRGETGIGEE